VDLDVAPPLPPLKLHLYPYFSTSFDPLLPLPWVREPHFFEGRGPRSLFLAAPWAEEGVATRVKK